MNQNPNLYTRLQAKFESGEFPILVSLPANDLGLARAAMRGGADGVKVHLNVVHRASHTRFGTFQEERGFLLELCQLGIPRAILIGDEQIASASEIEILSQWGFEYFDLYLKNVRPYLKEVRMRPMLALAHGFTSADMKEVSGWKNAVIEASIVDPALYGTPLDESDLSNIRLISSATGLPVVVPTQKKILPSELSKLRDSGAHGLLAGIIVTGRDEASIEASTREFVKARNTLLKN